MTLATTDLRDIGTLITCALRPKLRPAVDPTYRTLLSRFRSEPDFRNAVRSVLDGMDMLVLSDAADLGLILGPRRESLFAARLADVPNTTSVENRLIVGLVMAAIAAYAYPTADSFDDDRVRYVRVGDIERFLRETCESLKRDADEPLDDEALEEAWRVYERMPAVHRPTRAAPPAGCRRHARSTGSATCSTGSPAKASPGPPNGSAHRPTSCSNGSASR